MRFIGLVSVLFVVSCEPEVVRKVCAPGNVKDCPCGGGNPDGTQTCKQDGSAWKECDCTGGEADADTDADADSDSEIDPCYSVACHDCTEAENTCIAPCSTDWQCYCDCYADVVDCYYDCDCAMWAESQQDALDYYISIGYCE